jgi:hypothetical protein
MSRTTRRWLAATAACAIAPALVLPGLHAEAASAQGQHRHDRSAGANAVVVWNQNAGDAAIASCLAPGNNPPFEARMYAIEQLAVHDALQAVDHRSEPYVYQGHAPGGSVDAAVAAAAHDTLVDVIGHLPAEPGTDCRDAGIASVEADYAAALAGVPPGKARDRGLAAGHAAATAMLAARAGDGSDTTMVDPTYPEGTAPGEYRFTPGTPFVFLPHWGDVTPFALASSAQFTPAPPYGLNTPQYAADLNEIKRLGGDGVTTPSDRTPRQTETAWFWLESSPLAWNRIGRSLAVSHHLDAWQSARLFGLLDAGLADGYIASFHVKFDVYRYWRPVTAIRLADTDGNAATTADPTWTPLTTTPPIPDYDSAHSVEGAIAASVFRGFFGHGPLGFSACSLTLPNADQNCGGAHQVVRSYSSPEQAAAENGESRILVGFHFRHAVDAGLQHGQSIGRWTVQHLLGPDCR